MKKTTKAEAGRLGAIRANETQRIKWQTIKEAYAASPNSCQCCGGDLPYDKRSYQYCSRSCAVSINNVKSTKVSTCQQCGVTITYRPAQQSGKFCSNKCQQDHTFENKTRTRIEAGEISVRSVLKNYLTKVR